MSFRDSHDMIPTVVIISADVQTHSNNLSVERKGATIGCFLERNLNFLILSISEN